MVNLLLVTVNLSPCLKNGFKMELPSTITLVSPSGIKIHVR